MSVFLQAANTVVLLSFLARDILWLRMLSILAGLLFIAFYLGMAEPIWSGVAWNVLFISINAFHIVKIVQERRPVQLTDAELRLRELVFTGLDPRDVRRLCTCGEWAEHAADQVLVQRGQAGCGLTVILAGRATVHVGGESVAELGAGHLIGERSWITGEPPNADVVAAGPLRCLRWEPTALEPLLDRHPGIHQALQLIVGRDLARKLG